MPKTTLLDQFRKAALKKFLPHALSGVIGAVVAYLVDAGLLDGEGADALAGILLKIVFAIIGVTS